MAHIPTQSAKAYYNSASYATPTWVEVDQLMDVSLSYDKGEINLTTRSSSDHSEYGDGLKELTVSFSMLTQDASTVQDAFRDAFRNNTAIDVMFLDGPEGTTGSEGIRMTAMVKQFQRTENIGDALKYDVVLRPVANDDAIPTWEIRT